MVSNTKQQKHAAEDRRKAIVHFKAAIKIADRWPCRQQQSEQELMSISVLRSDEAKMNRTMKWCLEKKLPNILERK